MKPELFNLALDKSGRTIDADGRLHVSKSHITKAAINGYYGKEVPDYERLGLEPDKIYQLFRDPEELKKAVSTFARLPILKEHVPVTVDDPQPDLIIGAIGSDVTFNEPYIDADLVIWDAVAIAGIETKDVQELSCGYRYVPVMTAGEYDGKHYDGIMTEIRGNHLALVEIGRAGSDVVVGDNNPFYTEDNMKKRQAIKKAILAQDANISSELQDKIIDAVLGVNDDNNEDNPDPIEPNAGMVGDGSPADKIRELLSGKVEDAVINEICALATPEVAEDEAKDDEDMAEDEDDDKDEPMKKEEVKAAMDAAINAGIAKERAIMKAANEARRDVRGVVGDVLALDSASDIYGFALDEMGVNHKGVKDATALKAIFEAANTAQTGKPAAIIAQDSAVAKQFPDLNRFQRG